MTSPRTSYEVVVLTASSYDATAVNPPNNPARHPNNPARHPNNPAAHPIEAPGQPREMVRLRAIWWAKVTHWVRLSLRHDTLNPTPSFWAITTQVGTPPAPVQ